MAVARTAVACALICLCSTAEGMRLQNKSRQLQVPPRSPAYHQLETVAVACSFGWLRSLASSRLLTQC